MGQFPFVKRPGSPDTALGRRRSTRIEAAIRIILTGRDASGQPFREETETLTVNLHGGRLRTRHQVLVGMQVGIENRWTGDAEKAICVRVEEPAPGQTARCIAIQLVNPRNVWGIENPPADWEEGAGEWRVQGPASPAAVAPSALIPPRPTPDADVLFAELEKRSAELMESVLEIMRKQTDQIVAKALREFQQRLGEASTAGETRFGERVEQAFAELESALKTFRADLEDELTARQEQAVESAEQALRAKVAALVSTVLGSGTSGPTIKASDSTTKK